MKKIAVLLDIYTTTVGATYSGRTAGFDVVETGVAFFQKRKLREKFLLHAPGCQHVLEQYEKGAKKWKSDFSDVNG